VGTDEPDRINHCSSLESLSMYGIIVVDIWTHGAFRRQGMASRIMELLIEDLNGQHVYSFTDEVLALLSPS
jgi:tRNA(Met) C34 N-acetyltransferase TmcA